MTIRILPPTLVNRIAAGEVVERPASVVKELVENAIDAGATRIDVTLEQAGKNRIVVQDNGKGMNKEELILAVQRHATSKLPSDDLLNIQFLGFRGEALPSIGSVSRMNIVSRAAGTFESWSLAVEGGHIDEPEPASLSVGTRIEVCDLFYATPARLKFLKSDRTEVQQVVDILTRLSMAHPSLSFSLISDGRKIFDVQAQMGDEAQARLARLTEVMGKDFTQNAMLLNHQRETIVLTGFASLPTHNRGTSSEQYLFVNGRPVRDRLLLGSLRAAYQEVLAHNRHALAVLFFELPAEEVDVNVHPAKAEVRFRDSNLVRGMIVGAIKNALSQHGFRASATVASDALARFSVGGGSSASYAYSSSPVLRERSTMQHVLQHSFAQDLPPMAKPANDPERSPESVDYRTYPLGAARAQLHQTYIIAETVEGMAIIDQHAAHERLMLEKMKLGLTKQGIERQKLLLPEMVSLPEDLAECLLARQDELSAFGLVFEAFGGGAIVVREMPVMLGDCDVSALIREIADNIREYGESLALKEKIEHLCGTIACHGSIRAGRSLSIAEMNALLREMEATPLSGQCNHGRPTHIVLKRRDIEILFGRRG